MAEAKPHVMPTRRTARSASTSKKLQRQRLIDHLNEHNTQSPEHARQQGITWTQLEWLWERRRYNKTRAFVQDVAISAIPQNYRLSGSAIAPDFMVLPIPWQYKSDEATERSY